MTEGGVLNYSMIIIVIIKTQGKEFLYENSGHILGQMTRKFGILTGKVNMSWQMDWVVLLQLN